jgi:hypothetical protein
MLTRLAGPESRLALRVLARSEPRLAARAGPVLARAGRSVMAGLTLPRLALSGLALPRLALSGLALPRLALSGLGLSRLAGRAVNVRPERVRAGPGLPRSVPRLAGPLLLPGRRSLPGLVRPLLARPRLPRRVLIRRVLVGPVLSSRGLSGCVLSGCVLTGGGAVLVATGRHRSARRVG